MSTVATFFAGSGISSPLHGSLRISASGTASSPSCMLGKSTGPPGGRSGIYHDGGSRSRINVESSVVAPLKILEDSDGVFRTQRLTQLGALSGGRCEALGLEV